ncbi:NepR family anti-sigma factor [Methylopila musalis]|uniref:NepR family anti-sigma factor n=1 Tax=Methylopila musalis TaxID=1134781 RepID=A0ABW3Z3Y3_9HYPH
MTERKPDASSIDVDIQAHIGRQLRAGYMDVLNQPVPDRFLDLLAELDRKQQSVEAPADGDTDDLLTNGAQ